MKHINIIGYGINPLDHLTLQAINDLENSELVLTFSHSTEIDCLRKYCKKIINIDSLHKNEDTALNNYYRIYKKITSFWMSFNNISLLIPGHPRIGFMLTKLFDIQSVKENFTVSINPGISSFDTMINDLKNDPIERGSIIIDVNKLLMSKYPMNPTMDYYIYYISTIKTNKIDLLNQNPNNYVNNLKKHLLTYYSPLKIVYLIKSASSLTEKVIIKSSVSEVCNLLKNINLLFTLYIEADKK